MYNALLCTTRTIKRGNNSKHNTTHTHAHIDILQWRTTIHTHQHSYHHNQHARLTSCFLLGCFVFFLSQCRWWFKHVYGIWCVCLCVHMWLRDHRHFTTTGMTVFCYSFTSFNANVVRKKGNTSRLWTI